MIIIIVIYRKDIQMVDKLLLDFGYIIMPGKVKNKT